jgi:hypothetical protein
MPKVAHIDDTQISKIQQLEAELGDGNVVVAYSPESNYAPLTDAQVTRLRQLEDELGVMLFAFRRDGDD